MTVKQVKTGAIDVQALLESEDDYLRAMVSAIVEATLEAEMTLALGAEKGERSSARLGYRSGYYTRSLVTRVGSLELRVPQDRDGRFSTRLFERYQRSEKALVAALAEMYVQGVSTRKVKAITEELCGHALALRLGRGQRRGDADLLPAAAPASQAHEVDQHAGAAEPGAEAAHPRGAHLSQRCKLPQAHPGAGGGDPRELAGGHALPQHGAPRRTQKGAVARRGKGRLTAAGGAADCAHQSRRARTAKTTSRPKPLLQKTLDTTGPKALSGRHPGRASEPGTMYPFALGSTWAPARGLRPWPG